MKQWYVPERSALVIGGGIEHEQAVRLASATFGEWHFGGTQPEQVVPLASRNDSHLHIERDIEHTKLSLCYHMPGIHDEKAVAALRLISNFLGYGMSSLLTRELRHKRGLVYMTNVFSDAQRDAGMFKFTSFTRKSPAEVISVARDLIERVTDHFRIEDLDWVRRQYLGAHARNLAETSSRTSFMLDSFVVRDALYTPDERIAVVNSLTYDDIAKAAVAYLTHENSMLATMGRTDPGDL
jgi:predicted Zn-dependent peptidase